MWRVQTHLSLLGLSAMGQTWIFPKISLEFGYKSTILSVVKSLDGRMLWKQNEENLLGEKKRQSCTYLDIFVLPKSAYSWVLWKKCPRVYFPGAASDFVICVRYTHHITLYEKRKKSFGFWVSLGYGMLQDFWVYVTYQAQGKLNGTTCASFKTT